MKEDEARTGNGRQSAVRLVIAYLERVIRENLTKSGRLPTEPELAEIVGVSRTPVREAMKILDAMGVIEIRRGVGTFVRPHARSALGYLLMFQTAMQAATPQQLFEARLMIEHTTAELASIRSDSTAIARMRESNEELRRLATMADVDLDKVTEADIAFHKEVFDACGNPLIAAIGKLTIEQVRPWIRMTNEDEGPLHSVKIHESMISAIEKRDLAETRHSTALRAVRDGLADWHARLLKA